MTGPHHLQLDAFAVDVRSLLGRSVASLYSHLVTRPTGRAVRLAIESQLQELATPALSLVDLSSVAIIDYSCADEVVAKLLLGSRDREADTYFVLRGVRAHHRDPIEAVLERHRLGVVAEGEDGSFDLMGTGPSQERELWKKVEEAGWVRADDVTDLLGGPQGAAQLDELVAKRLLFRHPVQGDLHALSRLIHARP